MLDAKEDKIVDQLLVSKVTANVERQLKLLPNNDSRKRVKKLLRELTQHVEHVYELNIEERENYWEASFHLYDFLRQAGQVGRMTFGFNDSVKQALREILE
jgi:hypothetical protein